MLYLRLPKRLANSGILVNQLICEYEGMISERMLTIGFKKYYPSIKIVGYQHGSISPLLLSNFLTDGESQFVPIQDRIICNGIFFRNILLKEGLPANKLTVGPALRYRHLHNDNNFQSEEFSESNNCVLVPLPLMPSDGAELFNKVLLAFGGYTKYCFIIKPHPMAPKNEALFSCYGIDRLPNHFKFSRKNISEWLPKIQAVVSMSSSVVHEFAAAGIPLVVVGRDTALELNPLGFFPKRDKVFYSPKQIRQELERLMNLTKEERQSYQTESEEILKTSFNPVTDSSLKTFIACNSSV